MSDDNDDQTTPAEPEPKLVYEVTIDQEGTPKGELIQIPGLGTFANGETFDVNEDEHAAFRAYHTTSSAALDDDGNLVVEDGSYVFESNQGPTLLQASKGMVGVQVTSVAKGGGS